LVEDLDRITQIKITKAKKDESMNKLIKLKLIACNNKKNV